jgi:hypothetical protein
MVRVTSAGSGMSSLSLFHMCPKELTGSFLYPLSELELALPLLAERARRKYVGREWLPDAMVPPLGCRWMDVVMFIPVHPREIRDALVAAGHPRYPARWIEVDAAQLLQDRMALFLPGESPEGDAFAPFSPKLLADHVRISGAQREAYARGEPGKVLLFGHTAHVLHHGRVAFDDTQILSI